VKPRASLAAEEVIGKDVVNIMDEKVGTIADLVMDPGQKLVGVVLSVGGFLGIGSMVIPRGCLGPSRSDPVHIITLRGSRPPDTLRLGPLTASSSSPPGQASRLGIFQQPERFDCVT
jgi:PRC-barrel domain